MLHERAFSILCLFCDMALGIRLHHQDLTTTCTRVNTVSYNKHGISIYEYELCFLLYLPKEWGQVKWIMCGLSSMVMIMQDEITRGACTVRDNVCVPAFCRPSSFFNCKSIHVALHSCWISPSVLRLLEASAVEVHACHLLSVGRIWFLASHLITSITEPLIGCQVCCPNMRAHESSVYPRAR